jgi:hypothetical protein
MKTFCVTMFFLAVMVLGLAGLLADPAAQRGLATAADAGAHARVVAGEAGPPARLQP